MQSAYKCYFIVCIAVILCVPIEFYKNVAVTFIVDNFGQWPGEEVLERP